MIHPNTTLLALAVPAALALLGLWLMGDALLRGCRPMEPPAELLSLQAASLAANVAHNTSVADAATKEEIAAAARKAADDANDKRASDRAAASRAARAYAAAWLAQYDPNVS